MELSSARCRTMLLVFALGAGPLAASTPAGELDSKDFASIARQVSMEATFAALPRGEFAPVSFTLQPVIYHPYVRSEDLQLLPTVRLQWWISPNLALLGGAGAALAETNVVQLAQVGFRYLLSAPALGAFTPEFIFLQQRIDGLPEYTLKWNHFQWGYAVQGRAWQASAALALLYQRTFPKASAAVASDLPRKLVDSNTGLLLSAGYNLFPWVNVMGRLVWSPQVLSGGAQVSLAL